MVGFKTQCREHRREKTRVKTFLTTCPSPPLPSVLLFKHRYYDDDDSAKTPSLSLSCSPPLPSFFATSPPKSSCLDNGEMTRTVIGGAFFQARDSKRTQFQGGERDREREKRVWVFGRRRTKGEIGSDEAVAAAAVIVVVVNAYFLR